MKTLGTIFATPTQLAAADAFADANRTAIVARASVPLAGLTRCAIGGETRYYKTNAVYAVINGTGKILWFETRQDGDYPLKGQT